MNSTRDNAIRVSGMAETDSSVPRRNARQEWQHRATRRTLLSAAHDVFGERGYLDTTVEHVLVQAGVSRAAFYAHFDSKLSLVCEIATEFVPVWRPVFDSLMALEKPTLAALEAWASQHLAFHAANQPICDLLIQVASLEDRLYWLLSGQRDVLIHDLGERFDAFRRAREDTRMLLRARHLLFQLDQTCFMVVRSRIPDPDREACTLIAEQVQAFLAYAGPMSGAKGDR